MQTASSSATAEYVVLEVLDHWLPRGNTGTDYEGGLWLVRWTIDDSESWQDFWSLNEGAVNEQWQSYERDRLGERYVAPAYLSGDPGRALAMTGFFRVRIKPCPSYQRW